jgi:hypothetical protein
MILSCRTKESVALCSLGSCLILLIALRLLSGYGSVPPTTSAFLVVSLLWPTWVFFHKNKRDFHWQEKKFIFLVLLVFDLLLYSLSLLPHDLTGMGVLALFALVFYVAVDMIVVAFVLRFAWSVEIYLSGMDPNKRP